MNYLFYIVLFCLALLGAIAGIACIHDRLCCNHPASTPDQTTNPHYVPWVDLYVSYGEALCDCVAANHAACGLCRPQHIAQHLAADASGITSRGFVYRFDRTVFHAGGGQAVFSSVPVTKMAQILNQTLPNYCCAYGLPPLQIIYQRDASNGRVVFLLAQRRSYL